MFTLIYTQDATERRHTLAAGDTVVGRAALCDLVIEDASISRRHARFRVHGDGCRLTDLRGRNGTYLNGESITEAELRDGDDVVLGRFAIRIEKLDPAPVILGENHAVVETPGTVYRKVDDATQAITPPSADPRRLVELLTQISRQLVHWRPLPAVLERISAVALDMVPAERAFLLLVDQRTNEIVPHVARARDGSRVGQTSISRTIVRRTLAERLAMLATDAQLDASLAEVESLKATNVRSFMSVPLWNQGEAIGVLYVDSPRSAPLSAADLDILQALAAYAAVAIEQARLTARVLQEARHRERLERYHSPAVVDQILAHQEGADAPFLAEERDLTVLFADIVGFTSMVERMAPSEVAQLLNRCFAVMCDAVFTEQGTLDKFMGDAVLAVFGAPLNQPDHAAKAARTALMMRRAVAGLGFEPPIRLRITLNSGRATVGDIGSPRRREYTVLGDVVNTCSRMMDEACEPGQIVITGATRREVEGVAAVRPLGAVLVRGREERVELFELDPQDVTAADVQNE
jgi:adenylate cyclase